MKNLRRESWPKIVFLSSIYVRTLAFHFQRNVQLEFLLQAIWRRKKFKSTVDKTQTNATKISFASNLKNIFKRTVDKTQTNATNVTLHHIRQATWRVIWKHTLEKSHTYAANVIMHLLRQAGSCRKHLRIHNGEKLNKCNQCHNASILADNLKTHLKIHSRAKNEQMHTMWL